MLACLRYNFKLLFKNTNFYVIFVVLVILNFLSFIDSSKVFNFMNYPFYDFAVFPGTATSFLEYRDKYFNIFMTFMLLFIPLLFSYTSCIENKNNILNVVTTRVSLNKFIFSKYIVSILACLFVIIVPIILNLVWNIMTVGMESQMGSLTRGLTVDHLPLKGILNDIYLYDRILYIGVKILNLGIWVSLISICSTTLSLFFERSYISTFILFLIFLTGFFTTDPLPNYANYIFPTINLDVIALLISTVVILLINSTALYFYFKKKKEIV